jgi:hypothetical protein
MLRSVKVPGIHYWVRCGRMPNGGRLRFWSDPRRAFRNALQSLTAPGGPFSGDSLILIVQLR